MEDNEEYTLGGGSKRKKALGGGLDSRKGTLGGGSSLRNETLGGGSNLKEGTLGGGSSLRKGTLGGGSRLREGTLGGGSNKRMETRGGRLRIRLGRELDDISARATASEEDEDVRYSRQESAQGGAHKRKHQEEHERISRSKLRKERYSSTSSGGEELPPPQTGRRRNSRMRQTGGTRKRGREASTPEESSTICLRNVHMIVPDSVERGSKVEMKCQYDLEQEELYSVKWYRGDREFCRYSPKDVPPLKVFRIPGIEVHKGESDAKHLVIEAATQVAEGRYTCEVSADAPSFQTAQVHTHMYVVVLPKEGPSMYGLKRRYKAGMKLKVECISGDSVPAANLSFFINNEPALSQHVLHRVDGEKAGGAMSAYSTIQFTVQKHHFVRGKIKIRCTAHIYSIYLQSLEKSAEEERIRTTPISLPEIRESLVYSVHHLAETNGSSNRGLTGTTLSLLLLTLPTILG